VHTLLSNRLICYQEINLLIKTTWTPTKVTSCTKYQSICAALSTHLKGTPTVPFKCLLIAAQIDMYFVQEVSTGSYLCWAHALLSNRLICYQEIQSTYQNNMDSNKGNSLNKVQVYFCTTVSRHLKGTSTVHKPLQTPCLTKQHPLSFKSILLICNHCRQMLSVSVHTGCF